MSCSTCHTAWPALNATGWSFKMSGYRRLNGRPLEPTTKDIELAMGALSLPSVIPLAVQAQAGFDSQELTRRASDGTHGTRTGRTFDFNELELLAGSPLGKHLSFFLDYELFETEIEHPAGPGEADESLKHRNLTFESEGPGAPALAKLIWNSLLPESIAPLDSLNVVGGTEELPTAFSPGHRRLSVSPYLVYNRRALDLLSNAPLDDLITQKAQRDRLLRLDKGQLGVELNGIFMPTATAPTDMGKLETLILEYHAGIANGSNNQSDPNTEKDFHGRLAARWWSQAIGIFGYWSPDINSDDIRQDHSVGVGGFHSGTGRHNQFSTVGPDLTLSLDPMDIPVWLETQVLFNRESSPTGFNRTFNWWGGFSQLNAKPLTSVVAYARYDWLRGSRFNDTGLGGVTGPVKPREWDTVAGAQWYVLENFKLLGEYSRRKFENPVSAPVHQKLDENFFTVRAVLGF